MFGAGMAFSCKTEKYRCIIRRGSYFLAIILVDSSAVLYLTRREGLAAGNPHVDAV